MNYRNFTLRARDLKDDTFLLEVNQSPAGRMRHPVPITVDRGKLDPLLATLLDTAQRAQLTESELVSFGQVLSSMLFPDRVRELLLISLGSLAEKEGLRIQLVFDDPGLAAIPWEYVHVSPDGEAEGLSGFLALDPKTPIVRHEPYAGRVPGPTKVDDKLKIVVGSSHPADSMSLDFEQERGVIEDGLKAALAESTVELTWIDNLGVEELQEASRETDVFHYSGHAGFGDRTGRGLLLLENADGTSHKLSDAEFALKMRASRVRLVVVDACKSSRRDPEKLWTGIALKLMEVGIPASIGMQFSILDPAAISFSRGFYPSLAVGMSIEEAVTLARIAILDTKTFTMDQEDYFPKWDWGLPTLYLSGDDGIVFPDLSSRADLQVARDAFAKDWVTFHQRIGNAEGDVTGARIRKAGKAANVRVEQEIERIAAGAVVEGIRVDRVEEGANIVGDQTIDTVDEGGRVDGLIIGDIG